MTLLPQSHSRSTVNEVMGNESFCAIRRHLHPSFRKAYKYDDDDARLLHRDI